MITSIVVNRMRDTYDHQHEKGEMPARRVIDHLQEELTQLLEVWPQGDDASEGEKDDDKGGEVSDTIPYGLIAFITMWLGLSFFSAKA